MQKDGKLEFTKCAVCKKEIPINYFRRHRIKKGKVITCGFSCAAKWRMNQPEIMKKIEAKVGPQRSQWMKKFYASPEGQTCRVRQSEKMRRNNPSWNQEIKEKIKKTMQARGRKPFTAFPRGGNGRPIPKTQGVIADYFGWETEHILVTPKSLREEYHCPNHYKLDVANPRAKIAIEVDGLSHKVLAIKEKDKRKEQVLSLMGWKVIRVSNKDILTKPFSTLTHLASQF